MSSNTQPSQKLRRNGSPSTNKSSGPLRATIPVSLMTQSVIHDVPEDPQHTNLSQSIWSKMNPPLAVLGTGNTLQCGISKQSPWRLRQWSPTLKVESPESVPKTDDLPVMRRTASLDAIYLKGQWPRGTVGYGSYLLDKATQTPEEWMIDIKRFSYRGIEFSPSRERKQKQRMFLGHQALNPPPFQQSCSGSVSPNRVAASTNTEQQRVSMAVASSDNKKETSRAIPVPPIPTTQSSRARNSVEGFNTEIEKLVCRGNGEPSTNKMMEPTPDGHRAPIAELFKRNNTCRSVDTQTPVKAYSTNSSSGASSPCGSVSPSVWGVFDHHHSSSRPPSDGCTAEEIGDYNSLSPEDFQALALGTSPRGRFLCREPPDGCEKVETLKIAEHPVKNGQDATTVYCPPKPSSQFVLQPSSSSAFCSLNKFSASTMKSSSSSQLFHVNSSNGSGGGGNFIHGLSLGEYSDRSSSVPPQWPVQQQQQISSTVQMIPATPSGQPI